MNITAQANTIIKGTVTFLPLPLFDIDFELKAKCFRQEGDLKYEYNALRNLRLPTGELSDFRTDKLNFSLNSPVDIQVQPSYDGTVNLILNDDRNTPKLINSRFSVREDYRYEIVDRKGNNDTNIYDIDQVEQNTRLFKTTEKIPYVNFQGLYEGGALKSGNYVFYFKYCDADGNESDIITESGIISCYVGKINDPSSTRGGMGNELTNKIAKLTLENLDTTYDYINIYYTRSTGDYSEAEIVEAYKIANKKIVNSDKLTLTITGLEVADVISVDELNIQYNIVDKVKTQAQVQNMLFFGNVDKPTIPYKELEDLSLRIFPTVSNDVNIGYLDHNYKQVELEDALRKAEYNDAVNVYNYTGFWNKEMYRLAVVYIRHDDSLTPAFPIRGKNGIGKFSRTGTFDQDIANQYTHYDLYNEDGKRVYIDYDDDGFIPQSQYDLENSKGVVRILYNEEVLNKDDKTGVYPLSINFNISKDVLTEMKKHVKGMFFVRQLRIPTILCQGITIGVDNSAFTPALHAEALIQNAKQKGYITESFLDKSNQLVNDFSSRLLMNTTNVSNAGLLCPEAQLRSEYFNEVFTGALFNVSKAPFTSQQDAFQQSPDNNRHFYVKEYVNNGASEFLYDDIKLTIIEDNEPLKYSGTKTFSTRAGAAEEAWKYSFFGNEDRGQYATNLLRGAFGTFVGMEGYNTKTSIVDIHIPGFNLGNLKDYFLLRANSFASFFTMSNRYDLALIDAKVTPYTGMTVEEDNYRFSEYRGDCFINNYTTRIQRNFQDPETVINDIIVDPLSWRTNYTGFTASGGLDKEKIAKINRSDVNAVRIGHWATFKICSNINLAYRAIDESLSSERTLTGVPRAFFPYAAMSVRSESKIPESTVINVGYNSTTSDKQYVLLPNVPYIKNMFENRLMFSDIHVNDAFKNNYRVFQGLAYKDITNQYGSIVKMFDWRGNLLIVFSNGIGMMPINEKALVGSEGAGAIFMKGAGVLSENIVPLSTDFGSNWKDSIIQTRSHIYGVDTIAKKIWRTDGQTVEIISDFKVQKFLNDNITLGENDKTSMVALRNVKTHFNAFKNDVMFTFYDSTRDNVETVWNLCYNEEINKWVTRFTWEPVGSESINNVYFSFDRLSAKRNALIGYTLHASEASEGITLTNVNLGAITAQNVGTLKLKGYKYYDKYDKVYSLPSGIEDNDLFSITNDLLKFEGVSAWPKFSFILKVRVGLGKLEEGVFTEFSSFYDFISVKASRANLNSQDKALYDLEFSSYFWKHGQAGIFDITTPILPTKWYDKQEPFEYEFVVADNPGNHKIFDNLMIISNNAEPDTFVFEVIGDAYEIDRDTSSTTGPGRSTVVTPTLVTTSQKGKDLKEFGRIKGNMHYKEDLWDVEIKPHRFQHNTKVKEARIRDKYLRIRVKYTGTKLAIITALRTLYTISYA